MPSVHLHKTKSMRLPDPVWDGAKARAAEDGDTFVGAVWRLLAAYGDRRIDAPPLPPARPQGDAAHVDGE